MNKLEYKKAYLANLKLEVSNNNKNLLANKGNSALNQYIQNGGQLVSASTLLWKDDNNQTKKTKK